MTNRSRLAHETAEQNRPPSYTPLYGWRSIIRRKKSISVNDAISLSSPNTRSSASSRLSAGSLAWRLDRYTPPTPAAGRNHAFSSVTAFLSMICERSTWNGRRCQRLSNRQRQRTENSWVRTHEARGSDSRKRSQTPRGTRSQCTRSDSTIYRYSNGRPNRRQRWASTHWMADQ